MDILLVENDEFNREVLTGMLEILKDETGIDIHVDIASNGKEALEFYKNKKYDLILTDIDMPIMDGKQLLFAIKSIDNSQKMIAITAFGLTGDREKFLATGFDGYISKPVDYDELKNTVLEVLGWKT